LTPGRVKPRIAVRCKRETHATLIPAGCSLDSKVILRTWNDTEAELIRGLLESYGIPCVVISDITHSVYPLTVDGLGEIRLSVPLTAVEEAERILAEHQAPGPTEEIPEHNQSRKATRDD